MRTSLVAAVIAFVGAAGLKSDSNEAAIVATLQSMTPDDVIRLGVGCAVSTVYDAKNKRYRDTSNASKRAATAVAMQRKKLEDFDKEVAHCVSFAQKHLSEVLACAEETLAHQDLNTTVLAILASKCTANTVKTMIQDSKIVTNQRRELKEKYVTLMEASVKVMEMEILAVRQRLKRNTETVFQAAFELGNAAMIAYATSERVSAFAALERAQPDVTADQSLVAFVFGDMNSLCSYFIDARRSSNRETLTALVSMTRGMVSHLRTHPSRNGDAIFQMRNAFDRQRAVLLSEAAAELHTLVQSTLPKGHTYDSIDKVATVAKILSSDHAKGKTVFQTLDGDYALPLAGKPANTESGSVWADEDALKTTVSEIGRQICESEGSEAVQNANCEHREVKERKITKHRRMHEELLNSKENNVIVVIDGTADTFYAEWNRATALLDPAMASGGVSHEITSRILDAVSTSNGPLDALSELSRMLSAAQAEEVRLKTSYAKLARAHSNALEKIAAANASVSAFETQLAEYLGHFGAVTSAKALKKWDRAVAGHSVAIEELSLVLDSDIDIVAEARGVFAAIARARAHIRAVEHAMRHLK